MIQTGTLVSVVIPAYQAEWCIGDALASVGRQRYRPLEVIIVDDGSTDETAAVVEGLRESLETTGLVLRLLRLTVNRGAAAALGEGLAVARGEMICWLSADDAFVDPQKTARQLAVMRSSGAAVAYSSGFLVGATLETVTPVDVHWWQRVPRADVLFERRASWRLARLLFINPINGTSVMIRRSLLEDIGTFDASLGNVDADGDLWMRCCALGARFASISGENVFYREHSGQTSTNVRTMDRGCTRTRIRLLRALAEAGRLQPFVRRSWPALALALRGGYRQWPLVGRYLCERTRELRLGVPARVVVRHLEARLRREGLWESVDIDLLVETEEATESDEFSKFRTRLTAAGQRVSLG